MDEPHSLEENIGYVQYIIQRRIYDVLLGIYSNINPGEADALARLHDEGLFASPEPSISFEGEENG